MAEINLNDLLAKKQAEATEDTPTIETTELVRVNQQVETLTPEERKQVDQIKNSIDLVTSNAIAQYGMAAQDNIATFSDSILATVKSTNHEAAGTLLTDLVKQVNEFEAEQDGTKGMLANLPVVGSLFKKVANLKESYTTLAVQIDKIQAGLDKQKMVLMKDVAMFDGLFEKNLEYFKQLQLYIQAGEEKLQELNEVTIPKLEADSALR